MSGLDVSFVNRFLGRCELLDSRSLSLFGGMGAWLLDAGLVCKI